jgi:hypothetical protein
MVKRIACNRWAVVGLSFVALLAGASARGQGLSVSYEGGTLPADDPVAPWAASLDGCAYQVVAGGFLALADASDQSAYVSFSRVEPSLPTIPVVSIEARLRVLGNNGLGSSPAVVLENYDPALPPLNASHLVYAVFFFPDHIEFHRRRLSEGADDLVATISVPDLVQTFHTIRLVRMESSARRLELYVDGGLAAVIDNDPLTWPLTRIGFGHGFFVGAGISQWDYVRYWSEGAVPARARTWGDLKARYR